MLNYYGMALSDSALPPTPHLQIQPQEISPPPTANLDRSNDKVYENVTGLVKAVIEMSSKIQPAPPEEYVPMVKVSSGEITFIWLNLFSGSIGHNLE